MNIQKNETYASGINYNFPINANNNNNNNNNQCRPHIVKVGVTNPPNANNANNITPNTPTVNPPYTPANIIQAYNIGSISGNPTGKNIVIALIDAYGYTNVTTDLTTYCTNFGLKTPNVVTSTSQLSVTAPSGKFNFMVYKMSSSTPTNNNWGLEQALDVQMAHAIAPDAGILLVQATSSSNSALNSAIAYAISAGANVISMSWGGSEYSSETSDTTFNNKNVVFVASAGDSPGVEYPSANPNVLAMGGTTLTNTSGVWSETAWNESGGGVSSYEPNTYQNIAFGSQYGPHTNSKRQVPDLACVADPNTGVYVRFNNAWYEVGGTSVSAPLMAGIVALANDLRKHYTAPTTPTLSTPDMNTMTTNTTAIVSTYASAITTATTDLSTQNTNSTLTHTILVNDLNTIITNANSIISAANNIISALMI